MVRNLFMLLIGLFGLSSCVPLEPSGTGTASRLEMSDRNYLKSIHSVQLYPNTGQQAASLAPATTSIQGGNRLLLTFDDLQSDFQQYQARLVHCDWNWKESRLSNLQFLQSYNEFPVTQYDFSQNTRVPYVHYRFEVPRVKIPGNYVLVLYRNNNPGDVVLSRRFIVHETRASINYAMTMPSGPVERRENQQIDFTINYNGISNVVDPGNQFHVVIRQNQRWDNAIIGLKPTGIREGLQEIEYRPFDKSNQFKGGNEYRFFDLRTVQARGQNVGRVTRETNSVQAFLVPAQSRAGKAYGQIPDINGQFQLTNLEFPEPVISSEYVEVHFMLEADTPFDEAVYVAGAFSNYLPQQPYLMRYDAEIGGYLADIKLKQGWYNFLYLLNSEEKRNELEGNFAETENQYEIIVYYRPPGEIYDAVVGYTTFNSPIR